MPRKSSTREKPTIVIALGTRPEIVRFAPIIKELEKETRVNLLLLHTGQHYSADMDSIFFKELNLRAPFSNLGIGGSSSNDQLGNSILKTNQVFDSTKVDLVCVWGDTTSSLGVALAANRKGIRLCHIEAGCRSFDYRMLEEHNRIIIDHISDILIPLSLNDQNNLVREKVRGDVALTGDPLYDIFLQTKRTYKKLNAKKFGINKPFGFLTLHRAENVDNKETLTKILKSLSSIDGYQLYFPIHPRTKKNIAEFGLDNYLNSERFILTNPLGYIDMVSLLLLSSFVITDSGGVQKEAFFAKKPCITLRKSTEWVDTVKLKVNKLLNPESEDELIKIHSHIKNLQKIMTRFDTTIKPYGAGDATKKIVNLILKSVKVS